jgi:hypothetical protein
MANWTFDASMYQEKSFSLTPVGDYRARIIDVQEKKYSSGNEGYEITLELNGQPGKMWFYIVLDPSNPQMTNQRIGDFFNSFGITSPAMGTGKQWIGAVGAVRVKHEEYNGQPRAKVAYCIARSRQDKLDAWKGTQMAAAAQPAEVELPDNLPFD